jgi:hypothetical protein
MHGALLVLVRTKDLHILQASAKTSPSNGEEATYCWAACSQARPAGELRLVEHAAASAPGAIAWTARHFCIHPASTCWQGRARCRCTPVRRCMCWN